MALAIKDRVKETTTTTGTGTYTLGGAVTGFETFTANLSNSDTTYYACTDNTNFEVGIGTFTSSGTTLARTTILSSSNSNSAVNWSSGTRTIFMTYPADKAVFKDASNNVALASLTVDGSNISLDSTSTLNIDNSNASNGILIGTNSSGVPVSIGHTTSETIVNDNLSVTGDLIANGDITPNASDGSSLGSANREFSDLFLADGAVIKLGDDQDVTLTHVADTGLKLNSTRQLQFGDSGTYIHQSADGVLDLVSDTEIEINATTIDVNGNLDVSGSLTLGGTAITSTAAELNVLDGIASLDTDISSVSGSDDTLASAKAIKTYVDAKVTAEDLDVTSDSGTIAIDLDSETLTIAGGSGIDTSATSNTVTIAGEDATTSNKGVASFSSDNFAVSSGAVTIKDGGVVTDELADDAVTADKLASDAVVNASVASGAAIAVSKTALTAGTGISLSTNTLNVDAAQTGITSLLATDIKIGEDDQTKIDFETADTINFYAGNEKQLVLTDGALTPGTNAILDLGTDALEFKDAYFDGTVEADAITIGGTGIGSIYSAIAGSSSIVTTGALNSGSITSGFGTIDTGSSTITTTGLISGGSLDIDDVLINGTTIGHTDDTDLMTVADGVLTVAGEVSMTTLDIGGTNVTATAAELNYVDGVTSAIQTQIDAKTTATAASNDATALAIALG